MTDVQFVAHAPMVFVAGVSKPTGYGFESYIEYRGEEWNTEDEDEPEAIVEAAGRVCYHSWSNPRGTPRNIYLQESIVKHKHGSVLEHMVLNFLIADLPRSTQLELVRHRAGTAFSFESQRFTDKHLRFVIPPLIRGTHREPLFRASCERAAEEYQEMLRTFEACDELKDLPPTLRRKRAKEAAREVLPNACGSDGMVSINARALRHIIEIRSDQSASASIREFADALFGAAYRYIPGILEDATVGVDDLEINFVASKV